jgi:hypothetical protein|tara:strand:- start:1396 stop:1716 length:321 start_codon:yes stop_codon:yes gene_type:complete
MMRNETRLKINGRAWRVKLVKSKELPKDRFGDCDHPPGRHPTVRISQALSQRRMAEITVHELLHAALPSLDESAVTDTAAVIGRALFSLGWRRSPLQSKANNRSKQ